MDKCTVGPSRRVGVTINGRTIRQRWVCSDKYSARPAGKSGSDHTRQDHGAEVNVLGQVRSKASEKG